MATGTGNFPNRPFRLRVETWYNWQSGSSAAVHVQLWIDKLSYSPTWSGSGSSFEIWVANQRKVAWSGGFDFRNGNNFLISEFDTTATTNVNGDVQVDAYANYNILGYTEAHAFIDGYPLTPPPAPSSLGVDQATTTSLRYRFSGNGDGGSPIVRWEFQYSTSATFASGNSAVLTSSGTSTVTGLNPGTKYYFRARGVNAIGAGSWSAISNGTTLPSVPPGLLVTSSLDGTSSTLKLTPPGNATGVTEYNIEFRQQGGATQTFAQAGTQKVFTGLTPGQVYEYRANAEFGSTYTSPFTAWLPVSQPNPNTNPGNYFDGSTSDTADLDYSWVGTVNNSRSRATAQAVDGWDAQFDAVTQGVLYMVTGGKVSSRAARVAFLRDSSTSRQWHAGSSLVSDAWAEIAGDQKYTFSLWVNPSRTTRLAIRAAFSNGSSEIAPVIGSGAVVPSNQWTRLSLTVTAPANAVRGAVRLTDVSGTGYTPMLGGDWILLDGAMITPGETLLSYFDGGTADTTDFDFAWLGTAWRSASVRKAIGGTGNGATDELLDPDCPPPPTPPVPPTIDLDCIEEIGAWRRYFLQIPANMVPKWGAVLPTLTLRTVSTHEHQVRIRYYPNPEGLAPETLDLLRWEAEMILTYIPPQTELTLDGVLQRVWADVGMDGNVVPGDQLLFGTGGVPATWPELVCGVGYVVTLDVPLDSPAGNLSTTVALTQRI